MTVVLELSPEMAQKIADMASGHDATEETMRRTFQELFQQMPPQKTDIR